MHTVPMQDAMSREERVFILHVRQSSETEAEAVEDAAEIKGLLEALSWEVVGEAQGVLREATRALLLGTGKADEVKQAIADTGATVLVVDAALSPTQQRNWDRLTGATVVDRQGVILEIFADRAMTREALLQVSLARLEYLLPRLANSYTSLSRQRGGARGNRGQGETQIELDRRRIQDKIHRNKELLAEVRAQRDLTRKERRKNGTGTVALVGYTNAGKSSLQRALCGSDTFVADALFATLDPSVRQLALPGGQEGVLVDTVGFIRKLPHNLVEAFKATLEESTFADVLVHVVDLSNPWAQAQYLASMAVLEEIGASHLPMVLALNKIDKVADWEGESLWFRGNHKGPVVGVSALLGRGTQELLQGIDGLLHLHHKEYDIQLGYGDGALVSWLYGQGAVLQREDNDHGPLLKVRLDPAQETRVRQGGFLPAKDQEEGVF